MMRDTKRRIYKTINPNRSYPAGKRVFYECGVCGDVLPSWPDESVHCRCWNIRIDADAGRLAIRDHAHARCFCEQDD